MSWMKQEVLYDKKIIINFRGATTTLVGTSFAVVSCADSGEFKKTLNVNFSQNDFLQLKEISTPLGFGEKDKFVEFYNKGDRDILIKSSLPTNAINVSMYGSANNDIYGDSISNIDVKVDGEDNVKFIINPKSGIYLPQNEFIFNFATGDPVNVEDDKVYVEFYGLDITDFEAILTEKGLNKEEPQGIVDYEWTDEDITKIIDTLSMTKVLNGEDKSGDYSNSNLIENVTFENSKNRNTEQAKNNFIIKVEFKNQIEDSTNSKNYDIVSKRAIVEFNGTTLTASLNNNEYNENEVEVKYDQGMYKKVKADAEKIGEEIGNLNPASLKNNSIFEKIEFYKNNKETILKEANLEDQIKIFNEFTKIMYNYTKIFNISFNGVDILEQFVTSPGTPEGEDATIILTFDDLDGYKLKTHTFRIREKDGKLLEEK